MIIKCFKMVSLLLFLIFLGLFISGKNGYYEYNNYQNMVLTDEAIKQFEEDVKEGKNVLLEEYAVVEVKDYSNSFSDFGLDISKGIDEIFVKGLHYVIKGINSVVNVE